MHKVNDKPEIITLSHNDIKGIKARFLTNTLEDDDKKIILTIITTYQWLQDKLQNTKINIFRLRKLFGFKTEKRKNLMSIASINTAADDNSDNKSTELSKESDSKKAAADEAAKK